MKPSVTITSVAEPLFSTMNDSEIAKVLRKKRVHFAAGTISALRSMYNSKLRKQAELKAKERHKPKRRKPVRPPEQANVFAAAIKELQEEVGRIEQAKQMLQEIPLIWS